MIATLRNRLKSFMGLKVIMERSGKFVFNAVGPEVFTMSPVADWRHAPEAR